MAILPERLKFLREEKKLNQTDIAEAAGIVLRTYCRYESGEREPNATVLWKIADFYGVSVDYLIGRTDTP